MDNTKPTVAVLGGTGPQGRGLAYRLADSGHQVIIGSRSAERATDIAEQLQVRLVHDVNLSGATNEVAATKADIVIVAVPYDAHDDLVASLETQLLGKVVISCVNPLGFDRQGPFGLDVPGGSAAETAQQLLPGSTVIGAFHHLSAVTLLDENATLEHEDVLVCGDDADAKQQVIDLAASVIGRPGIDAGALRLARQLEPLTAVIISVNKRYKVHAGLSLVGLS